MEDDLRAQEEFYRSGEKPAASVVRANTPNKDKSNSIPENAFHSILSPVKEIKEHTVVREKVILEGKENSSGFPTAEKINVIVYSCNLEIDTVSSWWKEITL